MQKIAPAFIKAKKAFSPALKTATNPHFKSKYADLAACVEAVDDAFLSNGIVMYQETTESDTGVVVETVLLHESGEMIRCGKLHVPAPKHDPQGFGSALSYCRRYSLMAACGIAPEDDDGNAASKPQSAKSVAQDTWDSLPVDVQTMLQDIANGVRVELNEKGPEAALVLLKEQGLSAEHSVAIWGRFDSKERSAMKSIKKVA